MFVCVVPRKCLKLLCTLGEQMAIFAALLRRGGYTPIPPNLFGKTKFPLRGGAPLLEKIRVRQEIY